MKPECTHYDNCEELLMLCCDSEIDMKDICSECKESEPDGYDYESEINQTHERIN